MLQSNFIEIIDLYHIQDKITLNLGNNAIRDGLK